MQFTGNSQIVALPPYLTVQMMRFFFKRTPDGGQKAKILRKVCFVFTLLFVRDGWSVPSGGHAEAGLGCTQRPGCVAWSTSQPDMRVVSRLIC